MGKKEVHTTTISTFNHTPKEGTIRRVFEERDSSVGQTIAKVIAKQVILHFFFEEIRPIIYVIRPKGRQPEEEKEPPFRHV
jgi:hypothetical protein